MSGTIVVYRATVMKNVIHILILFFFSTLISRAQNDSLAVVHAWTLEDDFSALTPADLDTNLTNFQIYYPNYIYSKSNSFLGNLGTATISNIFTQRIYTDDAFYLNPYLPYFQTADNTLYYNTLKPFSRLTYTNGSPGNEDNKEETFEALITENITPQLNFALRYHVIGSKGQYIYQQILKHSFRAAVNYGGPRYTLHGSFNVNRYTANENGGLDDEIFSSGQYESLRAIPSRIGGTANNYESDAQNRIRYFDYMISQRWKLFTIASKVDTTQPQKKRNVAEPILTYVIRASRATKTYDHLNPMQSGLYENFYFHTDTTLDSIADFRIVNTARLDFKTSFRGKVQVGIFGQIGNDFDRISYNSLWDSTLTDQDTLLTPYLINGTDTLKGVNTTENINSTYFSTGIYGSFWNRVKTSFTGKVYFLGYKSGQTEWKGLLNTDFNILRKEFKFDAEVVFKNKVPSYLLQNYYSNHYIWTHEEQELKAEIWTGLSGKLSAPSNKFELTGNYYLISGLIYFGEEGRPLNYGNPVNVLSLGATKTFKLWKLYSANQIVYQVSENPEILAIPNLVIYNSTYLNHTFHFKSTGGELETMLGFDIYYTTSFYEYEYSPALSQFIAQEDILVQGYPLMDAFLNIKLKRTRFFVKLQHFNSSWFSQNYYAAIHYPHNQLMDNGQLAVKFGLSWVFYD